MKLPGWAWAVCVLGLVVSVLWGYSMGKTLALSYNSITTIPDTDPSSVRLEVLDFSDCLYVFPEDDYFISYNLIDYPMYATYYDTDRPIKENNVYTNRYNSTSYFKTSFINMNYYDVCCIIDFGNGYNEDIAYSFEPKLKSGNLELAVLALDKMYTTEVNEDGYNVIKSEYITPVARFEGMENTHNSIDRWDVEEYGDLYYVFVVGAESATGSYTLRVS